MFPHLLVDSCIYKEYLGLRWVIFCSIGLVQISRIVPIKMSIIDIIWYFLMFLVVFCVMYNLLCVSQHPAGDFDPADRFRDTSYVGNRVPPSTVPRQKSPTHTPAYADTQAIVSLIANARVQARRYKLDSMTCVAVIHSSLCFLKVQADMYVTGYFDTKNSQFLDFPF